MAEGVLLGRAGFLAFVFISGCAGAPVMTSADDVLRYKSGGADDSALFAWVQDPGRAFNLSEPDFERLKQARVNDGVIGELRFRSEEYRRSVPAASKKPKPGERQSGDGHKH